MSLPNPAITCDSGPNVGKTFVVEAVFDITASPAITCDSSLNVGKTFVVGRLSPSAITSSGLNTHSMISFVFFWLINLLFNY